jgi:hypothetical protein
MKKIKKKVSNKTTLKKKFDQVMMEANWLTKLSLYELVHDLSYSDLLDDFRDHLEYHIEDSSTKEAIEIINSYLEEIKSLRRAEYECE